LETLPIQQLRKAADVLVIRVVMANEHIAAL
jgi:hypothetical protein